jgi:hypothetical protein
MTGVEVTAIVAPVGVVLGWLAKHVTNGRGKPNGHEARVEVLLENIERHTSEIPLLRRDIEQHEAATSHAREQVGELLADMKGRQRRGE